MTFIHDTYVIKTSCNIKQAYRHCSLICHLIFAPILALKLDVFISVTANA
jgi:hypothetical protein